MIPPKAFVDFRDIAAEAGRFGVIQGETAEEPGPNCEDSGGQGQKR